MPGVKRSFGQLSPAPTIRLACGALDRRERLAMTV
jgi:hypothetical protein